MHCLLNLWGKLGLDIHKYYVAKIKETISITNIHILISLWMDI